MRIYALDDPYSVVKRVYSDRSYNCSESTIEGFCSGIEALRQSILKNLQTERCQFIIYSWSYGIDADKLIGKDREYVKSELKRSITETLLRDDRITNVSGFSFDFSEDICRCDFIVTSKFGELGIVVEVAT